MADPVLSGAKLASVDDESRRTAPWVCTHEEWMDKWAPRCPDGNHRRLLSILGFRLKGADYLQLRVALRKSDYGVCEAIIEEHPDSIYVRALACVDEQHDDAWSSSVREEVDCGVAVWLDAPLGERIVIDEDTGEELPLLIPRWGTGEHSLYVPRPPGVLWPPDERTG